MPSIHHHITELQAILKPLRTLARIALVPTMGNLHEGHLELVKLAKQHADIVIVSIFVNPTQFSVGEDFDSYPRTLEDDVAKLASVGTDYIFAPSITQMYPVLPPPTTIRAGRITEQLCGQTRPTHFDGVGIIVAKLFNIVQPDIAIFGQKDYQQLAIIKQLVRDLSYPIEIIGAPIVRAEDGLALSSRNQYLNNAQRAVAPVLQAELQRLASQLSQQFVDAKYNQQSLKLILESLLAQTRSRIAAAGFKVDYLQVKTAELDDINAQTLKTVEIPVTFVILVAAWLGRARLLDNLQVIIDI